jgi:hypothetical protein
MSTKMKWVEHHQGMAEHHVHEAKHHDRVAGHLEKLASALGKRVADVVGDSKTELEDWAAEHRSHAAYHRGEEASHREQADKCGKAIDVDDLEKRDQLRPTNVHAVAPTVPATVRAIPRHGQREVPTRPNVPLEFEKLVQVEDDER